MELCVAKDKALRSYLLHAESSGNWVPILKLWSSLMLQSSCYLEEYRKLDICTIDLRESQKKPLGEQLLSNL